MIYRNNIRAVVEELQLIEGLGESPRVLRVGQEETPINR